ncbi:unnamed protein product, partial [Lepidochelys kempii]
CVLVCTEFTVKVWGMDPQVLIPRTGLLEPCKMKSTSLTQFSQSWPVSYS